jgi:hypothetical protein
MSTRVAVVTVALVAAAVAVAAAALLPLHSGRALPAPARPIAVQASFVPAAVEFGDPVTARVVVTLATSSVRASTLHLALGVSPLTQLGQIVERRVVRGGTTVVTYELRAACLSEACISPSGRRTVTPPGVVADIARDDGGRATATGTWAPLAVAGRVAPADVAAARLPFRAAVTPPPVTYRMRPATLAALLDAAAGILAAWGVGLGAAALLRARRRPQAGRRANELARALQLAREARTRPERDRRTAAGYVARLLGRRDAILARTAGELAWSRPGPTPDSLTELVDQVEQERPA